MCDARCNPPLVEATRPKDATAGVPIAGSLLALLALAPADLTGATTPLLVSPGRDAHASAVEARCPTFSWGLVGGAQWYRLEVWPLSVEDDTAVALPPEPEENEPLFAVELPGSATSWTPAGSLCLERGRAYAWRLRADDLLGQGPWSSSLLFRIAGGEAEEAGPSAEGSESPADDAIAERRPQPGFESSAILRATAIADAPSSTASGDELSRISTPTVDLQSLQSQMRVTSSRFTNEDAAAVVGIQSIDNVVSGQTAYGVVGVAIDEGSLSDAVGVRGEAAGGYGVEGEGSRGLVGNGTLIGVEAVGGFRGGSLLGTGSGVGVYARGGPLAVADLVLGGTSGTSDDGILRSEPNLTDSDLFLLANDAVVVRLDADGNTADSDFEIRDGGNSVIFAVDDSGEVTVDGIVVHSSDRERKTLRRRVDPREQLDRLAGLPIYEWSWRSAPGESHLGPTAQEFQEQFGLGSDARSIATIDLDGVALAAIQGLHQLLLEQQAESRPLRTHSPRTARWNTLVLGLSP
jgi:hypothetical protein